MLKKKISQLLAAVMVATTVLGANVQAVGATVVDDTIAVTASKVENGTYVVPNTAMKIDGSGESTMNKFMDRESVIKVDGDKITVTMKFNEQGLNVVQEVHGGTVNDEAVELIKNDDGSFTFVVPSVDSKINIELTYAMGTWVHTTNFYLVNDITSIPTVDDSVNGGENIETPDNSGDNVGNDGSEDNGNIGGEESKVLEDGNYTLNNAVNKLGTSQQSMARQFIEEKTDVTVKDGKITMTLRYKGLGLTSIRNTNVKVNGVATASTVNEDKSVSFEVPSIDAKVEVEMDIYVPNLMTEIQSIDLVNDVNSLVKVDDNNSGSDSENNGGSTDKPENGEGNTGNDTGNDGSNNGGSNNGTTEEQGTKVYTGKLEVTHESETGLSMAKKALEETLKVEDVNGKKYVTLTFTPMGSTMMNNHTIYVNGNKVDATKTMNGEIVSLRFQVGSLEDSIKVSAYVSMMGSNVEFGVNVLEDTLTLVTNGTTDNSGTTGGTTGGSTTNNGTNNGTSGNTTTTQDEVKVTKGKLYSIQNSVTHESETGRSMARKYLNSTSKVEEIDGKYYVTLTFTGAEFMQNHVIYVNGKKATITKNTSGDTTNIRFAASSLSDSITVKTYVVPMDKEVEFGVTLLQDTLTFIKEYTVDTLPQTGAPIGAGAVAGLGLILTSAGTVLVKKRK